MHDLQTDIIFAGNAGSKINKWTDNIDRNLEFKTAYIPTLFIFLFIY